MSTQPQQPNHKRQSPRGERWIVVDFDGTCTQRDTTPTLVHLASHGANDTPSNARKRSSAFESLENEYLDAYGTEMQDVLPPPGDDPSKTKKTLAEAIRGLDDVSSRITARVSSSGCLAGIPHDATKVSELLSRRPEVFASHTALHEGCVAALAGAANEGGDDDGRGWRVGVLSVNWCPQLIDCVLMRPLREELGETDGAVVVPRIMPVWSNRLGSEDGVIEMNVPGADAKRDRVVVLRKQEGAAQIVYVGDSVTDLLALIEADVGILLLRSSTTGVSSSVERICARWKVPMVPLSERSGSGAGPGIVWTTTSWGEIAEVLQVGSEAVGKL